MKQEKLMKTCKYTVKITTVLTRELFKRRGLHRKFLGIGLFSTEINIAIKEILLKKRDVTPIKMPWKGEYIYVEYRD
jgi:hypothetical protein